MSKINQLEDELSSLRAVVIEITAIWDKGRVDADNDYVLSESDALDIKVKLENL